MQNYLVSKSDWSLHRKGFLDQQRHNEKLKKIIEENIKDVIVDEGAILPGKDGKVKIPVKSLEEYHFRYDYTKQKHVGQGNGDSQTGDVLGKDSSSGNEKGEAGEDPGEDIYEEVEIDIEEISEVLFKEFELPNLDPNKSKTILNETIEFNDIRKTGIMSNIDKKRTIYQAIKRNARTNNSKPNITREDLRFKTWDEVEKLESNAVIFAMMDTSGSMGTWEKYIARSFFFWMTKFLRTKYNNVDIRFLAHHTEAKEVNENDFFHRGESGGTRCSSVYQLALNIIEKDYSKEYNIYPFHFSDGDNIGSDNARSFNLVNKLLEYSNLFGYGEILRTNYSVTLMNTYKKITNPKFVAVTIRDKEEVYPALKKFFKKGGDDSVGS